MPFLWWTKVSGRALPQTPSNQSSRKIVSKLDDENTSKVRRNGTEISS